MFKLSAIQKLFVSPITHFILFLIAALAVAPRPALAQNQPSPSPATPSAQAPPAQKPDNAQKPESQKPDEEQGPAETLKVSVNGLLRTSSPPSVWGH